MVTAVSGIIPQKNPHSYIKKTTFFSKIKLNLTFNFFLFLFKNKFEYFFVDILSNIYTTHWTLDQHSAMHSGDPKL